ncbi:glycosyltransferase family 87 protein [Burkholderia guangdongensis]|uniref:glycosyltransferase family 87 protein n=1 Tax=Burkholderia guangdongensis TaxID=1792500 RepID=UPI0015CDB67A|nr:glycosyltransferase family 87 protein [Burkholderia guangdongensis]
MQSSSEFERRSPGRWLTPDRVAFYSCLVLLADLGFFFIHAYGAYKLRNGHVVAPGWDFAVFWSASYLTIHQGAASAFNGSLIESLALPLQGLTSVNMLTPWVYPPTFLLVVWPFALIPFPLSYPVFVFGGLLFAVRACTRLLESRPPAAFWFAAIAFPPVWIVGSAGQNSFLTIGLIGLGLAWLERRPWLAGLCFGLLAIKPQLGVLIPVALISGRQWRACIAAACTACVFGVVAGAALGFGTYAKFVEAAATFGRDVVEQASDWPWGMPTVFGAARHLGLAPGYAYAAFGVVAAIAVAAVVALWIGHARGPLRAAVLVIASLLCQPYLLSYDLVWMALPIVLLWEDGRRYGGRRGDLPVMVVAWLAPVVFFLPPGWSLGSAMPVVMLALLAVVVRRGCGENKSMKTRYFENKK